MKKRSLICFLCTLSVLSAAGFGGEKVPLPRGLFVTMIQNPEVLSSRESIESLIAFAKEARIDTLFVQIYRAGIAWFPSKVADSTPHQTAVKNMGEDPFAFLIRRAHENKIEIHAWLNMLSLSQNADATLLRKYGPEILTRNLDEKRVFADYRIDNQYFLEPGDPRVHKELLKIVREILETYPELDGLQFDYIRYPDANPRYGYAEVNMKRFKKATGLTTIEENSKIWNDWKRAQVTELLRQLVETSRAIRPKIQVSATGCAPYARAYHEAFQDWPSWIEQGVVDFVTFMSYSSNPAEYGRFVRGAKEIAKDFKKVNVGVPAYKLVRDPARFANLYEICENASGRACVVFHYGSIVENPELVNSLLQGQSVLRNQK